MCDPVTFSLQRWLDDTEIGCDAPLHKEMKRRGAGRWGGVETKAKLMRRLLSQAWYSSYIPLHNLPAARAMTKPSQRDTNTNMCEQWTHCSGFTVSAVVWDFHVIKIVIHDTGRCDVTYWPYFLFDVYYFWNRLLATNCQCEKTSPAIEESKKYCWCSFPSFDPVCDIFASVSSHTHTHSFFFFFKHKKMFDIWNKNMQTF